MKKVLLGSTALLSAALLSQGARADDQPVKIGISGYYQAGYMATLGESKSANKQLPDSVSEYGQLNFSGDTKFANGIGAGVFIQMYGFNHKPGPVNSTGGTNGQIEQSWLHITGAEFGEFRIGDLNDVRRAESVTAPEFSNYLFGVNSPDLLLNNASTVHLGTAPGTNTTTAPLQGDYATGVAWFSPTVSGFQFAVSYAPDNVQGQEVFGSNGSDNAKIIGGTISTSLRNKYGVALTWGGTVYGLTMNASAAISGASLKQNTGIASITRADGSTLSEDNPFIYNIGYSVAWGPWALGADYEQYNNRGNDTTGIFGSGVGTGGTSSKTVDLGFTYTIGNWVAGAEISQGVYKGFFINAPGAKPVQTQAIAGATYNLGPGVSVSGGLETTDWNNNGANADHGGAPGYDNVAVLIGSNIKF